MTRVRLLRDGKVTLPAEVRQKLKLGQGDWLEAEVVERGVLLKPVSDITREEAWERIVERFQGAQVRGARAQASSRGRGGVDRGGDQDRSA